MTQHLELGLDTFGDVTAGADGGLLPHAQVIRNVIDEAVLADAVGIDFFGVGEHHRADFAVSSPEVVLAAIAGRTSRIRLGSAVTVLSSDDPVRVFSGSRRSMPRRTDAPRSFSGAARSPSPSPCSDTSSANTRSCSRRSLISSRR
jgi:hypothetical protein